MLKNYIKTALRNLSRQKGNAIINILGLAVGFAAFLMLFLVVQYQQSFDNFHPKKDKLYRIVRNGKGRGTGEYRTGVPVPVTAALRTELPQLANVTAIIDNNDKQVIIPTANNAAPRKFREVSGVYLAEPQFFKMFNFALADGNINSALNEPNTALLSKDLASKYFGDWKGTIGKTFKLSGVNMKVTGILNNPPANTDFPLKMVISYITLKNYMNFKNWGGIDDGNYCLVELANGHSEAEVNRLLANFTAKHITPINKDYDLALQPLSEVHFDERYGNYNGRTFSKDLILALTLIGAFLLIVACVNFINLTVAQAVNRSREVGVRKVLGGNRSQLVMQFLGETGITALMAMILSLFMVIACIPACNSLMEIQISAVVLYNPLMILFLLGTWLLVSLLSGFYPALVLSGFRPVSVLKSASGTDQKKVFCLEEGSLYFSL